MRRRDASALDLWSWSWVLCWRKKKPASMAGFSYLMFFCGSLWLTILPVFSHRSDVVQVLLLHPVLFSLRNRSDLQAQQLM